MLKHTEEERPEVIDYYLWQSPEGTEVKFAQKVYAESVIGHTHAVWVIRPQVPFAANVQKRAVTIATRRQHR
jgi:hypothetical protein